MLTYIFLILRNNISISILTYLVQNCIQEVSLRLKVKAPKVDVLFQSLASNTSSRLAPPSLGHCYDTTKECTCFVSHCVKSHDCPMTLVTHNILPQESTQEDQGNLPRPLHGLVRFPWSSIVGSLMSLLWVTVVIWHHVTSHGETQNTYILLLCHNNITNCYGSWAQRTGSHPLKTTFFWLQFFFKLMVFLLLTLLFMFTLMSSLFI